MRFSVGKAVIFAVGAAVGAAVSGVYFKRRYEKIAQEDNEARRKRAREKADDNTAEKTEHEEYSDVIKDNGYDTKGDKKMDKPCIISPDEFGENEDYETTSLTYYADGVLTDEADQPMTKEEIQEFVGFKALRSFGEYEDDSVFVRNDVEETYYEILKDSRRYGE